MILTRRHLLLGATATLAEQQRALAWRHAQPVGAVSTGWGDGLAQFGIEVAQGRVFDV